jgi:RNA-binding protein
MATASATASALKITSRQRRYLRSLAHHLDPLVQLGKAGLGPKALREIDRGLADHELIKVKIICDDREEFSTIAEGLAEGTGASLVQTIGRIVVLYRKGEEPEIKLP